MADSKRKDVMDAILAALNASTGINYATLKKENWWNWPDNNFPGVIILDRNTEISRIGYTGSTTADDREAKLTLSVRGFVHTFDNDTLDDRTNLIRDVDRALQSSTALDAEIQDIETLEVDTDEGVIENYSLFDETFLITYHYNQNRP